MFGFQNRSNADENVNSIQKYRKQKYLKKKPFLCWQQQNIRLPANKSVPNHIIYLQNKSQKFYLIFYFFFLKFFYSPQIFPTMKFSIYNLLC